MGSREKGNRNEREAAEQLREQGWMVHKTAGGRFDSDAWDIADLIALKHGGKVLLVQVKTNGFTGKNEYEEKWREMKDDFPYFVTFEMWSRYDGGPGGSYPAAWRKLRFEDDGFVEFLDERVEEQVG